MICLSICKSTTWIIGIASSDASSVDKIPAVLPWPLPRYLLYPNYVDVETKSNVSFLTPVWFVSNKVILVMLLTINDSFWSWQADDWSRDHKVQQLRILTVEGHCM